MSHRVTDERLKELERSHRAALGWALDDGLNIIADLRDSRARVAELEAALQEAEATFQDIADNCDFWPKGTAVNALARLAALRPETEP